ncbi:MAG: hypothetical protein ACK40O_07145 [Allosphingosinicella sp.]
MPRFPLIFIAMAAAAASPASAGDKLGARTASPEQLLAELGLGVSDAELERAVAAAAAHPLGTRENPVRVGGPEGERAYIARLRCADGSKPQIGPRGSTGVGAFGTIVDAYPIDCGAAAPGRTELIMDMYHAEHREDRAPAGFLIEPR